MLRRWLLLLLAVVTPVVVVACDNDEERREQAARERTLRRHQAASEVVVKAYHEGRLGPPEEVKAEIAEVTDRMMPAGVPAPSLFDVEGNMLTYDRLDASGRVVFDEWVRTSIRLDEAVGQEIRRAERRADLEE